MATSTTRDTLRARDRAGLGRWPVVVALALILAADRRVVCDQRSTSARTLAETPSDIVDFNPRSVFTDSTPHFLPHARRRAARRSQRMPPAPAADEQTAAARAVERVKVANTGGAGAILRAEPPKGSAGDRAPRRHAAPGPRPPPGGRRRRVAPRQNAPTAPKAGSSPASSPSARLSAARAGSLSAAMTGTPMPGPVPEEPRVFGHQAAQPWLRRDAELVARLPVVLVQRLAVGAEVLRPAHVFDLVVRALGVEPEQAGRLHRLVLDPPLNRVRPGAVSHPADPSRCAPAGPRSVPS